MTELGQALVTCTWRWHAKLRGEMWRMRRGKRKWAFFFWCGLDRISRDKWVTVAGRREKGIAQCRFQSRQKDKPGENDKYHEQKKKRMTQEHILLTPSEELSNNGMYEDGKDWIHHVKATTHCITSSTELPYGMEHTKQLHCTMAADSKGIHTH